ncbi:glycosyltransferase family 2 protein [Campylobacter sp. RM12647]|uniref:glycosyltransferase family 2 protein n=1 Tax=Campylobacter sp. RM12647 TaxID=2735737 RepID=UPI001D2E154B|nr:glycosyltransferase [Campylobacter sp. RM12647]
MMGGGDNSIKIAKNIQKKDNRIKIIQNHSNLKTLYAKLEGIKYSTGDIVTFLDPDDELELNACEEVVKLMSQNIDIAIGGLCTIYNNHKKFKIIKNQILKPKTYKSNLDSWQLCAKFFRKNVLFQARAMLLNQQIKSVCMLDDGILSVAIILSDLRYISFTNATFYKYYKNETSITIDNSNYRMNENLKDIKILLKFIKNNYNQFIDYRLYRTFVKIYTDILRNTKKYNKNKMKKLHFLYLFRFYNTHKLKNINTFRIYLKICSKHILQQMLKNF